MKILKIIVLIVVIIAALIVVWSNFPTIVTGPSTQSLDAAVVTATPPGNTSGLTSMKYPSVSCVREITIPAVYSVISMLNIGIDQASSLLNPSRIYIHRLEGGATLENHYQGYTAGLCLDAGFVSNFPSGGVNTGGVTLTAAKLLSSAT